MCGSDENILNLDSGGGHTAVYISKLAELYIKKGKF